MTDRAWLVAVDLQRVFADQASEWRAPRYAAAEANVVRLAEAFGERSVFTRFVAPQRPTGAWVPYFEQYSWARAPDDSELYALTSGVAAYATRTVTSPTFGKWTPDLRAVVGEQPQLVVGGVATDCCVISTVLAAADAGASVLVVTDACAGSSDENHAKAIDVMGLYAPLVRFATTDEVLA